MFDAFTIRIIAGVLLALVAVVVLHLMRVHFKSGDIRLIPVAVKRVSTSLLMLWIIAVNAPFLALFLALFFPSAVYGTFLNVAFPADTAFQILGLILFFVGGPLALYSSIHLGRFMVPQIVVAEDHRLITSGPYSRIRHPTYSAAILMSLSLSLFLLNLILMVDFLFVLGMASYRAKLEEELLSSEDGFGAEYVEYMKRTGRFLPKLRRRI